MGKCAAAANCTNCASCVAAVASFVNSQKDAVGSAAVAAAWDAQFSSIKSALGALGDTLDPAAVKTAISNSRDGNLGKRAGSLCTQMQCKWPVVVVGEAGGRGGGGEVRFCVDHEAAVCWSGLSSPSTV